jgi:hypothetical protein
MAMTGKTTVQPTTAIPAAKLNQGRTMAWDCKEKSFS